MPKKTAPKPRPLTPWQKTDALVKEVAALKVDPTTENFRKAAEDCLADGRKFLALIIPAK